MNLLFHNSNNKCLQTLIVSLLFLTNSFAQQKNYTAANAHAHNDYIHPVPFYTAYDAGFGSVEADIFPVNGILVVAHSKGEIQPNRTLKSLYIDPLAAKLSAGKFRKLKLLVDIKEDYLVSLQLLLEEIEPLKSYLSTQQHPGSLIILITGNRPPPADYKNYAGFIFFDDDLKLPHSPAQWKRVGQVSLPFNKITDWKGEHSIDRKDEKKLRHIIDSVHAAGKPIRFWAAPDTQASWDLQMKLGADLIGTDKIEELAAFLMRRSKKK